MENEDLYKYIRESFCNLTSFKVRKDILEIITAFSTLNNKFVSVFITKREGKFIITDGGWIDMNYYENPCYEESEDIISKAVNSYASSYQIKKTVDASGQIYYYKTCNDIKEIPAVVFNLASFIVGAVNTNCIRYKDEKEEKEREAFRKDANTFLKENFQESVFLRQGLDDFKNIRFNAIINKKSNLYLITYVTGSTPQYFENDLRKTIVNFEISEKSKDAPVIKERLSIVNDSAAGFVPNKSTTILELLNEKTSRPYIPWSQKEKVLEYV